MPNYLLVQDETGTSQLPLHQGVSRLGSGGDCELRLDHEEVQPLALTLDYRGETLIVHNRNPFAVFVGEEELQPSQMTAWPVGAPLRMTRSVTLTPTGNGVVPVPKEADDDAPVEKSSDFSRRQMVQLGVILLCLGVAYRELNKEAAPEGAAKADEFHDLLEDVTDHIKVQADTEQADRWSKTLQALQEAHFLEKRPGARAPGLAIAAYQRVLESDAIRSPSTEPKEAELSSRVFQFATAGKVRLGE